RNCVSNIHPPDGLDYPAAAAVTAALVAGARELGRSGVALKDTTRAAIGSSSASGRASNPAPARR
ncbi:ethanolamine ammonia-lyase light chain EutC, partial [Mycobacterium sp. E3298]|uniref:ethanolamine ammonia-lyase light chain EutC n=1 Tax=Mycobacterium sp. E3298 TaxID=1856865 RepID=UPI000B040E32